MGLQHVQIQMQTSPVWASVTSDQTTTGRASRPRPAATLASRDVPPAGCSAAVAGCEAPPCLLLLVEGRDWGVAVDVLLAPFWLSLFLALLLVAWDTSAASCACQQHRASVHDASPRPGSPYMRTFAVWNAVTHSSETSTTASVTGKVYISQTRTMPLGACKKAMNIRQRKWLMYGQQVAN